MRISSSLIRRLAEKPSLPVRIRLPRLFRTLSLGSLVVLGFCLSLSWVLFVVWAVYALAQLVLS
ncbi:hypothetical protein [Methylobacterium sp. A54F]